MPRSQRGTAAVEMAIVLPALMMFSLGLLDMGRLLWTYATLSHAVEAAARCGAINTATCGTTATIQAYAVSQAWGIPIANSAFTPSVATCGEQVIGVMSYAYVLPWFYGTGPAGNTSTLTATSCYPT
jgi:Flp pilus assembly protein TadG